MTIPKKGKRFGFVTLGADVPSTRFRFLPYQKPLATLGHRCRMWTSIPSVYDYDRRIGWRLSYQLKKLNRNLQWLDSLRFRPDTIYLERGCFHDESLFMEQRFRRATPRFVLDVDDGIFLQFPKKIRRLIEMSDHVVVSNNAIFEYVAQYHTSITEIPTSVPLERFFLRPNRATENGHLVVGWIGTTSNMPYLAVCAEALRRVANELDFTLLVVGPTDEPLRSIDLGGVSVRFEKWSADTEISLLHRMDIGLMPLQVDSEWVRYKAATKLVQYMSIGIPAIASPIGVNADILADGRCGIAASTTLEWTEALMRLLTDQKDREVMGRSGRRLVEERFSVEANLPKLEQVLCGSSLADPN